MKARQITCSLLLAAVFLAPFPTIARTLAETRIDPQFELSFGGPFGHLQGFHSGNPAWLDFPEGGFYVLGFFDRADGVATTNIVRLTPDGQVDPSFRSALKGVPQSIQLTPQGGLLVWSSTFVYSTNSFSYFRYDLSRLHPDGTIDPNFNFAEWDPSSPSPPRGTQPLPDGRVMILLSPNPPATHATSLLRLDPHGSLDDSFQLDPAAPQLHAFHVQPDGNILALGETGTNTLHLHRYTSEGALDETYEPREVSNAFFLRDGSVLAIQAFTNSIGVHRIDPSGTLTPGFVAQILPGHLAQAVEHPNGKITLLTSDYDSPGVYRARRLTTAGEVEAEFALPETANGIFPGGWGCQILALACDELLVRPVNFYYHEGSPPYRLNSQGEVVAEITPLLERIAGPQGAVPLPDGAAFVYGGFTRAGTQPCHGLIRLQPDGSIDPEFQTPGLAGVAGVRSVTIQPDGKLLLTTGHHDYFVGRIGPGGILRLHSHGSRDRGFGFALNSQSDIRSLHLQSDGKILIAGAITNESQVFGLMRLNPDGTIDPSFQPFPGEARWVGMSPAAETFLITTDAIYSVDASGDFQPVWSQSAWSNHGFTSDLGAWFLPNGELFMGTTILSQSSLPSPPFFPPFVIQPTHYTLYSLVRAPGGFLAFGEIQASSSGFAQTKALISLDEFARIHRVYSFPDWWDRPETLCVFPDDSLLALQPIHGPAGSVPILRKFRLEGTVPPSISVSPTGTLTVASEDWNTTRIESSTDLVHWTHFHTLGLHNAASPTVPQDGTNYFFRAVHDSTPR